MKVLNWFRFNYLTWILTGALVVEAGPRWTLASPPAGTPPVIASFTPTSAPPGTSIEIRGSNFADVSAVQFNGAAASFTVLVDLILATVPPTATTGPISVTTAAGKATTSDNFTVTTSPPPVITDFSPTQATGGASVEIRGNNFTDVTAVRFNGVDASFRTLAGSIIATVPASATSGPISVTTASGTTVSSTSFTVTQLAAPVIASFSPTSGSAGTSVQITGSNLTGVVAVKFNGTDASYLAFGGALSATVPANATTGPITVITPGGTNSTTSVFTVTTGPAPVITSFTPTTGEIGAIVEIRGQFLRDVVAVKFNNVEAAFTNSLFRPLTAVVPLEATSGPITVLTASGTAISADSFTVVNPRGPVIDSFSPASAEVGAVIDIRGTNLTSVVRVEFNGVSAQTFFEFTTDRLLATVPASATTGPIKVVTQFGAATSKESLQIGAPPSPVAPPLLSIRALDSNRIQISWPLNAAGFLLQTAERLEPQSVWVDVAGTVETTGGKSSLTLDVGTAARFYRLAHP